MKASPSRKATTIAGSMNCHTEIPAARSTTSSEDRLSIRNTMMVPINTAKGRVSSENDGKRRMVIQASTMPGTSSV